MISLFLDTNSHSELNIHSPKRSKGSLDCNVSLSHSSWYAPDDKYLSLPTHVNQNSRISFHKYYEILTDDKHDSSYDSCECTKKSESDFENLYETIKDIRILRGRTNLVMSKRVRNVISKNSQQILKSPSLDEDRLSKECMFLNSLPDWKRLLSDFWPMCFVLPNGKVYTQLIDLTVCIQESLQSLLSCFQHSHPSHNSCLTLQVIGDLYQTYKPQKSSKKKGIQFVEWNNSFSNQGVVICKVTHCPS